MRNYTTLSILALSLFIRVAVAHGGEEHSHGDTATASSHRHTEEADIHQLMTKLESAVAKIRPAMEATTHLDMHTAMDEIDHLASHIAEQAPAEQRQRIEGTTNNIRKIASTLHNAAHSADNAVVLANLKKLEAMLPLLRAQVEK